MPPWVAFAPKSTSLFRRRAIGRLSSCLKCHSTPVPISSSLRVRCASAYVSPTAINVRPNIPPRNEELYNALSELSTSADTYVNISRLQLALRGLATQDAVTRVAVLALSSQTSAQKLARLLLADPLGTVEPWERELENSEAAEGAVLLQYGDESDAHSPNPLYKVLSIPSRILGRNNIEILISTLNTDTSNTPLSATLDSSKDSILVPKLQPASARVPVDYPVHKTLLFGEGLDSAVEYGRFTSDSTEETRDIIKVAIDLPPAMEEVPLDELSTCSMVNVDVGTQALASFRQSIANSEIYERGWYRSGLPAISQWLVQGLQPSDPIKPVLKALVVSIVDDAASNITKEDALQLQKLATLSDHQQTSEEILGHIENWAEHSHTELRDQLDAAFSAKNWHKLSWWKLFWRVDDVSMITSEILERRWLVDAEKRGIYLAGRMEQAGFPQDLQHISANIQQQQEQRPATQDPSPSPSSALQLQQEKDQSPMSISTSVLDTHQPWHAQISTSRAALQSQIVPPLQALAQTLVLQTLSTTSLTSALSALLYISLPSVSLFEASAVAALGLVYSLRRMQKKWETGRERWQVAVREEGRKSLKYTEEMVRWIVRGSEKPAPEAEGVAERRVAREAVERVRGALEKL